MADENKTERVQLLMTPSEVKAIDDWSFEKRIRGRAEAMRRLCQIGLGISGRASELLESSAAAHKALEDVAVEFTDGLQNGHLPNPAKHSHDLVESLAKVVAHLRLLTDLVLVLGTISDFPDLDISLEQAIRVYEELKGKPIARHKTEIKAADLES